ncbi:VOC family protein [Microvirga terricola]|uniref:Glyoxalase n=1 Tax=Microvirga terricola TaxID=2719797 RepID=A0ABX0VCC1_9HYPH|nr:VOC family protein [Microvirga terricola]NIX77051.1 glyoxalase [Microvirga terricola]
MMLRIDHVQLAMPAGAEEEGRRFYIGVLGMEEVPKPATLAARGGVWFKSGEVQLHLGVEADFRPATKAHPAVAIADLDGLAATLRRAGHEPIWDDAIPNVRRFYVADPFGNRLEFMAAGA